MSVASALDVVSATWPLGSLLLDVGCGAGQFVRSLVDAGYSASGCDPQAELVEQARLLVPQADFRNSGAQSLPYDRGQFDGAIMVHSLHHVPIADMQQAVREAMRCIRRGGRLAVVEPLTTGSFFTVLRALDDETEIRDAAQAALARAVEDGDLVRVAEYLWTRRQVFADVDEVITFAVKADPTRANAARRLRPLLENAFAASSVPVASDFALDQPIRCDVFAHAPVLS
jgi:ubiquinone/menaquinone biosynthesis C-methylase UbiE